MRVVSLAAVSLLVACHSVSPPLTPAALPPQLATPVDPVTARLVGAALEVQRRIRDVHLANLANVDTPGFKRRLPRVGTQTIDDTGGAELPVFSGTSPDFAAGTLTVTDRALDVAIDGTGLFAVQLADGSRGYTRGGHLHVDADGKLVTANGDVLLPEIRLPDDVLEIAVDAEGRIHGRTAGSPDTTTWFGELTLARFVNSDGLQPLGNAIWCQTEASGPPRTAAPGRDGLGLLKQGFLEGSNVERTRELIAIDAAEQTRQHLLAVATQLGLRLPAAAAEPQAALAVEGAGPHR